MEKVRFTTETERAAGWSVNEDRSQEDDAPHSASSFYAEIRRGCWWLWDVGADQRPEPSERLRAGMRSSSEGLDTPQPTAARSRAPPNITGRPGSCRRPRRMSVLQVKARHASRHSRDPTGKTQRRRSQTHRRVPERSSTSGNHDAKTPPQKITEKKTHRNKSSSR